MTFEEFFKKKRISLAALEQGEPALFSEFKVHFEKMGEKSFDHTKKYWFNKLRLRFPAPAEVKVEKVNIANTLAEQTIVETLTEAPPAVNVGFKPRFKPGLTKSAQPKEDPQAELENSGQQSEAAEQPAPALGFKPKFKAGLTKSPATEPSKPEEKPAGSEAASEAKPALGFKPKFKAGITKPAVTEKDSEPSKAEQKAAVNPELSAPKPALGFKPKFKAGASKPAPPAADENKQEPDQENSPA